MAFSVSIDIQHRLPVINGFVSIPDGQAFKRTSLTPQDVITLIPGTTIMQMGRGLGAHITTPTLVQITGVPRQVDRFWLVLPGHSRTTGAPEDWYGILRDAAS